MDRIRITERDLRLLGIFRAVAELGGLTAAEARLGMERSTISRHLQTLELRLGGSLCSRGPTGFDLTELGQKVLRAALSARDVLTRVEEELAQSVSGLSGELFLGIADHTISNTESRVVETIGRFQNMAPGVEVHLSIRPPMELVDELLMRRLDCAVFAMPAARFKMSAIPLFEERFRLYARGPAPLALGDLAARGYAIAMREGHWQSEALAAELGLQYRGVGRGLEAVALLVASGRYVGFLPTHLVQALPARRQITAVAAADHLAFAKTFSLVHDPARSMSAAARLFAEVARNLHA